MASVAVSSANSNYILIDGIAVSESPGSGFKTLSKPIIFQYTQRAGFSTFFMDDQSSHNALQNYMSSLELYPNIKTVS